MRWKHRLPRWDKTTDRTQRLLNHASSDTLAALGVVRRFAVAVLVMALAICAVTAALLLPRR